jgi:transcriptional regulator with XRE-family HTH domain
VDLAGRLRKLIDRDFGGSLNEAARTWRVPQPSLYRWVHGLTASPRAETLQLIAEYYRTEPRWFLTGRGPNPLEPTSYPIRYHRDWELLVDSLGLSAEARQALLLLPGSIGAADHSLRQWGLFTWKGKLVHDRQRKVAAEAAWTAGGLELRAWTVFFDGLVRAYGREKVRRKIDSEVARLRLGYQPFALQLLNVGELPSHLDELYRQFAPTDGPPGFTHLDDPARPPLDAVEGS